jgi:hypothetical protein
VRHAVSFLVAAALCVAAPATLPAAQLDAAGTGGYSAGLTAGAAAAAAPSAEDCDCVQQPPWHGSVRGPACPTGPKCRGSNVYQANPWAQLHWRQAGPCVTLPPCLPRFDALMREGYLLSPVPPTLPRCRQCGAAIEGGF